MKFLFKLIFEFKFNYNLSRKKKTVLYKIITVQKQKKKYIK